MTGIKASVEGPSDSSLRKKLNGFLRGVGEYLRSKLRAVRPGSTEAPAVKVEESQVTVVAPEEETEPSIIPGTEEAPIAERGVAPFDIKRGLLASAKAKTAKDGSKYVDVPIKQRSPVGAWFGSSEAPPIPRHIFAAVTKALAAGSSTPSFGEEPLKKPTHKSSVYANMRPDVQSKGGMVTFRRVSAKSAAKSWIHPGFKRAADMARVAEEFRTSNDLGKLVEAAFKEK